MCSLTCLGALFRGLAPSPSTGHRGNHRNMPSCWRCLEINQAPWFLHRFLLKQGFHRIGGGTALHLIYCFCKAPLVPNGWEGGDPVCTAVRNRCTQTRSRRTQTRHLLHLLGAPGQAIKVCDGIREQELVSDVSPITNYLQ